MHCARCNYDLRGHTEDQCCPECGLPVRETMALRRRGANYAAIGPFVGITLALGCVGWFVIFGMAWFGEIRTIVGAVAVAGILPAFLSGVVGRRILGENTLRMLATCFSWPMCGWGIGALFEVPSEGWGMAFWAVIGASMLGAALAGTFLADWARRYFTSS